MKTPSRPTPAPAPLLLAAAVLISALSACGEDSEPPQAAGADSVAQAILNSVAAEQPPRRTSPRLSPEEQEAQPTDVASMGYNYGDSVAPVKVLELTDFGCGYCRQFHMDVFPSLKEIYVDAGFIEWKFIPFVMGRFPNGLEAATAAECAGEQDGFFGMKDRLFLDQGTWRNSDEPNSFFSGVAAELELDVERFDGCIQDGRRDSRVGANIRLGQQAGVRGTPTFFIDARPLEGALPLDGFRDILDTALRLRGVTPPPR